MDARREGEFSEDELAYLNSGGQAPLPPETEAPAAEPEAAPEAEAQAEPAPQAAEEPDIDVIEDGDETHKGRKVKYGAYLRQRSEAEAARKERDQHRQELETVRREAAVQNARIQDYLRAQQAAAARQAQPQQPQQPAPPPDPNENPLGALEWQRDRLAQLEQQVNQTAQERHHAARISQLENVYRSDNHQAAREVPEYTDAYNFMVDRAFQIIKVQNPGISDQQAHAEVERQERLLAETAIRQNQRPAALIFQMARVYGWAPQLGAPVQAARPDPASQQAKLDAVSRGQDQNRSLSAAGRPGANTASMTLERFMSLSDDEARDWNAKNPGGLERLSGGR